MSFLLDPDQGRFDLRLAARARLSEGNAARFRPHDSHSGPDSQERGGIMGDERRPVKDWLEQDWLERAEAEM